MDLHIPEQKFTLAEGGYGNIKVEVLPVEAPIVEAPVEVPAVTAEVSAEPATSTEAATVDVPVETVVEVPEDTSKE